MRNPAGGGQASTLTASTSGGPNLLQITAWSSSLKNGKGQLPPLLQPSLESAKRELEPQQTPAVADSASEPMPNDADSSVPTSDARAAEVPAPQTALTSAAQNAFSEPPSSDLWSRPKPIVGVMLLCLSFGISFGALFTRCGQDDGNVGATLHTSMGDVLGASFVEAGAVIDTAGTAVGQLVWIENLCEKVLDCRACPVTLANSSGLAGKIVVYRWDVNERLYMCGVNRIGRALGSSGIVALAHNSESFASNELYTPGFQRRRFRLGSHRDAEARDGDSGIPFPQVELKPSQFQPILTIVKNGGQLNASLVRNGADPFLGYFCGTWVPIGALLTVLHISVAERAALSFWGHVRASDSAIAAAVEAANPFAIAEEFKRSGGVRLDLAQLSLASEVATHLLLAILPVDPFMSYFWGFLPGGMYVVACACTVLLHCSSTLLLAAYWYQMISNNGLASTSCETRVAHAAASAAIAIGALIVYWIFVEVVIQTAARRTITKCLCSILCAAFPGVRHLA